MSYATCSQKAQKKWKCVSLTVTRVHIPTKKNKERTVGKR